MNYRFPAGMLPYARIWTKIMAHPCSSSSARRSLCPCCRRSSQSCSSVIGSPAPFAPQAHPELAQYRIFPVGEYALISGWRILTRGELYCLFRIRIRSSVWFYPAAGRRLRKSAAHPRKQDNFITVLCAAQCFVFYRFPPFSADRCRSDTPRGFFLCFCSLGLFQLPK